jgi:hypothetical protein
MYLHLEKIKMVLGEDVLMAQIMMLREMALAGKFYGHLIVEQTFQLWMGEVWFPLLGYITKF